MSIRANPDILADLLVGLNQTQQQLNQADTELASGRSINVPSDNPAGTSALILNHAAQDQADTYQTNVGDLQSKLQTADSALNSGVTVITQAISLGVEAGNGTLSANDRVAIAQELSGIQQQLVGIGNTTVGGTYLFAGTLVETAPFTLAPATAAGVTYNGNSAATPVQIANGFSINSNVPGNQLFLNPSGNVLGSIQQLITAVQNNSGISAAVTALGQASSQFNTERITYGTALTQLQSTGTFLTNQQLQLSTQETDIDAANTAQVVTQFSQAQIAYASLIEAEGKILNLPNILSVVQ
jgi:flagellar hook-associated protein 3 FlgL